MGDQNNVEKMELQENEAIICPAIWIDDGEKYDNQPKNINTGYVVYGIHVVDIFFRMSSEDKGKPINLQKLKVNEVREGYYTTKKRFVPGLIDY